MKMKARKGKEAEGFKEDRGKGGVRLVRFVPDRGQFEDDKGNLTPYILHCYDAVHKWRECVFV